MRSPQTNLFTNLFHTTKHAARAAAVCLSLGLLAVSQVGCSQVQPVTIEGLDTLERSPALAVDVENPRGSILVTVNPKLTAPRIGAIAFAGKSEGAPNFRSDDWATAKVTESDGRAVLTVRTILHEGKDAGHWIQLTVEVPSCDGIRAKNSDGAIELRGVSGAMSVENGGAGTPGGGVFVEGGKPITAPVTITTSEGGLDVVFPTDSTGDITLISGDGRLASLAAWTGTLENTTIRPGFFHGVLNRGTNPVRLKCGEGDVNLRIGPYRVGNPQKRYYKQWLFSMNDRVPATKA